MLHLRQKRPSVIVTCARGRLGQRGQLRQELIERYLGIPVATVAPSIATVYRKQLWLGGQLFLAISQSGQSDDLIESALMARRAGALVAAIVNDVDSPLAAASDIVLPMAAGPRIPEVAATKTFVATLAVLLRLVASWAEDRALAAAIERLPGRLAAASELRLGSGTTGSDGCLQHRDHRPRTDAPHRMRSGIEAQGSLRPPR